MTTNTIQNRLQLKETTPVTFSRPATPRSGKRTPSILQCTLPHERPFTKQPTPTHTTEDVHSNPASAGDSADAWYAAEVPTARTAGNPHRT